MFSNRGYFKGIPCPVKHDCALPNCLFSHDDTTSPAVNGHHSYDPTLTSYEIEPSRPHKRMKLDDQQSEPLHAETKHISRSRPETSAISNHGSHRPTTPQLPTSSNASRVGTPQRSTTPQVDSKALPAQSSLISTTRTVSPPAVTRPHKETTKSKTPYKKSANTRGLAPRNVNHPPAKFEVRDKFLKKLYQAILDANLRFRQKYPDRKQYILSQPELETQAMDDEERLAGSFSTFETYRQKLADCLKSYLPAQMDQKSWQEFVKLSWYTDPEASKAVQSSGQQSRVQTGLESEEQEIAVLNMLRTGLQQYAQYGYVTKQPSEQAIAEVRKLREGPLGNVETCDRCSSRFSVFPGRNKDGELTSAGHCVYHWSRITRSNTYPCCGQGSEARGCTEAPHHVFKVTDPARLALLLPFKETPTREHKNKPRRPVVFDCEMSYTTLGLELVRVTALAWPSHKTLLDVLVRPIGEILDMNTRFSGVTADMLTNAKDYGLVPRPKYEAGEALQRVASPAAAREFLFDLLDRETPLIGHAIENDLNACRIIHPFVIDTVLLYPHIKGMPMRMRLRDLTRLNLGRTIQASSSDGHDSKEDSIATGDLVLKKVGEKWLELKRQGFQFGATGLIRTTNKAGNRAG